MTFFHRIKYIGQQRIIGVGNAILWTTNDIKYVLANTIYQGSKGLEKDRCKLNIK